MKHKIWGLYAFVICCWLVFVPRHHPHSRREPNTSMLTAATKTAKNPIVIISGKYIVYDFPENIKTWSGIVFGILSGGKGSFEKRQSVRDTWCSNQKCLFIVAGSFKDIKQEYEENQDILWLDIPEGYLTLTYKTQVFMHVVQKNIDKLTYALKTDDDSFIFVDRLKKELTKTKPDYWGRLAYRIKPMRGKDTKFYTPVSVYPNKYYPDYCRGSGYALSKLFLKCAVTKLQNLIFMPWEDVATGILANMCKVSVSDASTRVDFTGTTPVTKKLILKHKVASEKDMMQLYSHRDTNTNHYSTNLEFVHITKTGGSAIEKAAAAVGIAWGACHFKHAMSKEMKCPTPPDLQGKIKLWAYKKSMPWHVPSRFWEPNVMQNKKTFTVVRNPYTRAISEYYNKWGGFRGKDSNDPVVMNSWIQRIILHPNGIQYLPQHNYVYNGNKKVIDFVIHFENLQSEFNALMEQQGLAVRLDSVPFNSRVKGTTLTESDLDENTIAMINNYASKDFEFFGYEKKLASIEKDLISIGIKTMNRPGMTMAQILSIRKLYPKIKIFVVDDGEINQKEMYTIDKDLRYAYVGYDLGLSACRNKLVSMLDTEYVVIIDDDMLWGNSYDIYEAVRRLQNTNKKLLTIRLDNQRDPYIGHLFKNDNNDGLHFCHFDETDKRQHRNSVYPECYDTDIGLNVILAQRLFLSENPWPEEYKVGEHALYFWLLKNNAPNNVIACLDMSIHHNYQHEKRTQAYLRNRQRAAKYIKKFGGLTHHSKCTGLEQNTHN